MHWILIIISSLSLPLQFQTETNRFTEAPFRVEYQIIQGFESKKTCEYAGDWIKKNLRRQTKCLHL